jgi:hypothetical protein
LNFDTGEEFELKRIILDTHFMKEQEKKTGILYFIPQQLSIKDITLQHKISDELLILKQDQLSLNDIKKQ